MVFVRIAWVFIFTETFSFRIVIMKHTGAGPFALAFDAEMIIGCEYQVAGSSAGFMNSLCQCDRSRNAGADLFCDRDVFVCCDIVAHGFSRLCEDEVADEGKQNGE